MNKYSDDMTQCLIFVPQIYKICASSSYSHAPLMHPLSISLPEWITFFLDSEKSSSLQPA